MTQEGSEPIAEQLVEWARRSPSPRARSVVSQLADINRASEEVARLIRELTSAKTLTEQSELLGALEVWMYDELLDRLTSIRQRLHDIANQTAEAAG